MPLHCTEICLITLQEDGESEDVEDFVDENQWIDYGEYFMTAQSFASRQELRQWVSDIGRPLNIYVFTKTSTKQRIWIGCERSGKYRQKKVREGVEPRSFTGSKKCECPFSLKGTLMFDGTWKLEVWDGRHSHHMGVYAHGHSGASKLTPEQKRQVRDLTACHVKPRMILKQFQLDDENTAAGKKDIYNCVAGIRAEAMEGRTVGQQLMKSLDENRYVHWHRLIPDTDIIRDVLFAHRKSIQIARMYPYVLVVDSTYKTNRYKMPFLEVVGVSPTHHNFSVAFGFMGGETEDSYVWAMSHLRLLFDDDHMPSVIITDRELALMNAIDVTFPGVYHMLCRRHILKNVQAKATTLSGSKKMGTTFSAGVFRRLIESRGMDEYTAMVGHMNKRWGFLPALLEYVEQYWLGPYKQKFVRAWTDNVLHLGCLTTNRVESAHASLKHILQSSVGSFDTVWSRVHTLVTQQIGEIKRNFEQSRHRDKHLFKNKYIFKRLSGKVTHHAVSLLLREFERTGQCSTDPEACGCYLRNTHGLPCAHEMAEVIVSGGRLHLDQIHPFWSKMDIEADDEEAGNVGTVHEDWDDIEKLLDKLKKDTSDTQKTAIQKIRVALDQCDEEFIEPNTYKPRGRPKQHTSTKRDRSWWEHVSRASSGHRSSSGRSSSGRGSSSSRGRGRSSSTSSSRGGGHEFPYAGEFPTAIYRFIQGFHDVEPDGNCGFRVISHYQYHSELHWATVRLDLFNELQSNGHRYVDILGGAENMARVIDSCYHFRGPAPMDKWMDLLELGWVVATRYNVVCSGITSSHGSSTYLPLCSNDEEPSGCFTVGFLSQKSHFIAVHMTADCPLPPVHPSWILYRDNSVLGWDNFIEDQTSRWPRD